MGIRGIQPGIDGEGSFGIRTDASEGGTVMNMKPKTIHISKTMIDNMYLHIERYLWRYGVDQASRDLAPLRWYIDTGRASNDFIKACAMAKPFMIGRKLHQGGSYQEVVQRIRGYLNC